jgi:hypothetical protein
MPPGLCALFAAVLLAAALVAPVRSVTAWKMLPPTEMTATATAANAAHLAVLIAALD